MSAQRVALPLGRGAITIRQHFFDAFVPQPRLAREAVSRGADRSGLKNWPCALPTLEFVVGQVLPEIVTARDARADGADGAGGGGGGGEQGRERGRGRDQDRVGRVRVLELGSGCGVLGIGVAACSEFTDVVLTDPDVPTRFTLPPSADADADGDGDGDGDSNSAGACAEDRSSGDGIEDEELYECRSTLEWLRRNVELNHDIIASAGSSASADARGLLDGANAAGVGESVCWIFALRLCASPW